MLAHRNSFRGPWVLGILLIGSGMQFGSLDPHPMGLMRSALAQDHAGGSTSGAGGSTGHAGGSGSGGTGHTGGSGSGGTGHAGDGESGSTGHTGGSGSGGGHSGSGESGGGPLRHGTRYGHEGHAGGHHGAAGRAAHERGDDRFGGGNGLHPGELVPEGIGRQGGGFEGSSLVEQGRFRYWGGWALPDLPSEAELPEVVEPVAQSEIVPGPGGGPTVNIRSELDTPSRCEGLRPNLPAGLQYAGQNLLGLNTARGLIDPALVASGKIAAPYLMGAFQIEMLRDLPNIELAGTYLGLMAKVAVTPGLVKKIGAQVCGNLNDSQAQEIAQVAEQQRLALSAIQNGGGEHETLR